MPGGKIIDVNKQGCESLGYTKDELIGNNPSMFDCEISAEIKEFGDRLSEGKVVHFQSKHKRKNGSIFPVEVWIKGFWLASQRLSISVVRDLSENLRLEEQFRQAQKMEAVGRLAGGMAHDFNNLLTVIGGYCELILSNSFEDQIKQEFVAEIKKAHDRAATLTQQLLSFSRRKLLHTQQVDVNLKLVDLQSLLERVIGEDVKLTINTSAQNATAKIDAGQFEHAIVNMVVNARDAMPDGGTIHIATKNVNRSERFCVPGSALDQCHEILEISITDTGCGIEENVRSRLFEPFFTTKAPGKGTGLGLAMVYGFVQQSGGQIQVDSRVGNGSTFSIFLPAIAAEPIQATSSPKISAQLQGTETVLLVEDEQSVRDLAAMTLRSHGYKVLIASDGLEGLSVSQAFAGQIDLLLTDMVMPNMNGWKLAETLTAQRPNMRVLFISGYLEHSAEAKSNMGEFGYCPKPFTPSILLGKIHDTLAGKFKSESPTTTQ